MNRRTILKSPLALAVAASGFGTATADTPIKFIMPGAVGTGGDTVARFMAAAMKDSLGTSIVVDNKPGAGGVIGTDIAAKSPPDGNTVLVFSSNHFLLPWVHDKIPYDPENDFVPVAAFGASALVVTISANSPYSSMKDFLAAAKKDGGESLSYCSAGRGTLSHICGELMNSIAGTKVRHVPYKSTAQAMQDVAAGEVTLGILGVAGALPLIRAGRLKPVAVTSLEESAHFPGVPSMAQSGLPGYDVTAIFVAFVPKGTPQAAVEKLSKAFLDAASTPAFKEFCTAQALESGGLMTSKEFAALVPKEFQRWKKLAALTQTAGT